MEGYRGARIFVQNRPAGVLKETDEGYSFRYVEGYDGPAVSLTLPVTEKEYESKELFPFFDGLIPEGWLLDVVVKNWKLNREDRFGILLESCRDCIGDVSVVEDELL